LKIIAGALKGRRLVTPRGATTRPTADQVRIALMDTLAPRLPDARVLDLFAGAGGVGLEALRANVEALGVGALVRVRRGDVLRELPALYEAGERFDVAFLDPPYEAGLVEATLQALGGGGLLMPEAVVVAQHFTKRAPAATIGALASFRARRFGETTLTFYRAAPRA
jgi:16S rRNA (guanine966-N2)-methyltransferase